MSRSRRKTPICSVCGGRVSNKQFKIHEHRKERRAVKQALHNEQQLPHPKQYGNEWSSPRDGKMWIGDMMQPWLPSWFFTLWYGYDYEEIMQSRKEEFRRLMRK